MYSRGGFRDFCPCGRVSAIHSDFRMKNIRNIRIEEFDYHLPDERIARHPLDDRDSCLLLERTSDGRLATRIFRDLPDLLPEDSILVYNNTRVINARLRFRKEGGGALIEVFCLEPSSPADYASNFASVSGCSWVCFVGNSKRWKDAPLEKTISIHGTDVTLRAVRLEKRDNSSIVRFDWDAPDVTFSDIISAVGEIPIPPYLNRPTETTDSNDYQTVYGRMEGSVAAPTAGLHFTDRVLGAIDAAGIRRREVTLHVGAGTFQPVKSDEIGDHAMHSEFFEVSAALVGELAETLNAPVIAVGTTSVRTLESLYHAGCLIWSGRWDGTVPQWYPYSQDHPRLSVSESMAAISAYLEKNGETTFIGNTRLMIAPGYTYRIVDGMITNFHQPRSTLLLLVSAMIGDDWKRVYRYALDHDYRFLSYGDACLFFTDRRLLI